MANSRVKIGTLLCLACSPAFGEDWSFQPHIYARGGVTYDADLSRSQTEGLSSAWNLGPWNEESSLLSNPLTEITLDAHYGESFTFTYGVDVNANARNHEAPTGSRTAVEERLAYLTYKMPTGHSLWVGSRPYRSEAEYLSRAFNFDNRDLYGGGARFVNIGPVNIEVAYGSFKKDYATGDAGDNPTSEQTNLLIHKVEYPMEQGRLLFHSEVQQTHRTSNDGNSDGRTHGYAAGLAYSRWGDRPLGGHLYNQFLVHHAKGYVLVSAMSSAFNTFDKDHAASKTLIQWNGDYKKDLFGLYWVASMQEHRGKDPTATYKDSEMVWSFADLILRPQYDVAPQTTIGAEYARRGVMKEGDGLQTKAWAQNTGTLRWSILMQYHLKNRTFQNPYFTLAYGEVIKDKEVAFFHTKSARSSHFWRLNYEININ